MAELLIAAGATQPRPRTASDPGMPPQEFIDTTGRGPVAEAERPA